MEEVKTETVTETTETSVNNNQQNMIVSNRKLKQFRKLQKQYKKQNSLYVEAVKQDKRKDREEMLRLKNLLGKDDFLTLKKVCTIVVPAETNEAGEITQPEQTILNRKALITEGKNLVVLKREERIKAGLRSRSSGSSSQRRRHKSSLKYINERSAQAEALEKMEEVK